jgi:hypothetical protein
MFQRAKYLLVAFLAGACLLWFVPCSNAQVLYGSVVGTVKDQSGGVVPGVTVTVTNTQTGQTREGISDAAGNYSIPNVLEGTYDLSVTMTGFRNHVEKGIVVSINTVRRADVTLQVGQVNETVTVEASAAVLQTTKADVAVNLEANAIENLPLGGYRNYQSLINLVPGATPGALQNAVTDTPGRSLTTNVNGQDRGANNTRLDGAADILITMPHHAVYVPPVESVETVNISTNNFDAEQGITGGAAITVATKSGTNDFHGSFFGMHDNSALRAKRWQENRNNQAKPNTIRNIDGASIGGPIVKNKLFFFGDWEGTFERVGYGAVASVFPNDYRTGDFSRMLGPQILDGSGKPIMIPTTEGGSTALREGMVFDPFTGDLDGTGRSVFSSGGKINAIPQARFNAPMKKLLALIPAPSLPGDVSNYYTSGGQRLNRNNLDFKVNWNRSDKNQIWVKYSIMKALVTCGFSLGQAGGPGSCTGGGLGEGKTQVQVATIGTTYTVSPTFLADATVGWTRFGQQVDPPDLGSNFGLDVLGLPGTNGPDPRESGMPAFYISGYTNLGNAEGWNPLQRNDQSYTFNVNFNKIKGNHDIRFGLDLMHHLMNHWQPELGEGPRGAFDFAPGTTALNPDALDASVGFQGDTPSFENDWNGVASFLLGVSDYTGKSSQYIKMDSLENTWALYVRDRWRVTPKLTLNLGLRWELYPTRRRSQGMGIESYDVTTNDVLIGGWPGVPQDNGIGFSKKLFAPRFGFAYQMASDTVIRGGYGITYHSHPWGAQALRGFYPLTIVGTYSGVNGYQPITTDPNYVAAGIPNAPLGSNVGILSICCPDRSKGRQQLPLAAVMGYPAANEELKRGYIQSWNLIVEHKLPGELVTSVGYVGSHSVNGFGFTQLNVSNTPGSGEDGQPLFAKFGRTGDTMLWNGRYDSNYHSLQATVNRRFTGGLFLKGAYTWSHAIGEAEYSDWTEPRWSAPIAFGRNRASTAFNRPHMLQLAYVYELPFGAGKSFAQNGAARAILGGWQINGIFSAVQGGQYTMSASGSSLNMPGFSQTPDQVKADIPVLGGLGDSPYFDTSAFARISGVRFGNIGRNTMRGPARVNMDFSLFRKFKITEKFGMEFRAESFNLTNTPHFGNPNGSVNSSNFGKILSDANDPRSFRFGMRFAF